jgi:hypothetical protein
MRWLCLFNITSNYNDKLPLSLPMYRENLRRMKISLSKFSLYVGRASINSLSYNVMRYVKQVSGRFAKFFKSKPKEELRVWCERSSNGYLTIHSRWIKVV